MKKALVLATVLSFSASVAFAGGPVVVADEGEPVAVVTENSSSSGAGILPLLLGVLVIAAVAGSGS